MSILQIPGHALPLLSRLLEERVARLNAQLQRMHTQALNSSDSSTLDILFEDIHWLLLISGNLKLSFLQALYEIAVVVFKFYFALN